MRRVIFAAVLFFSILLNGYNIFSPGWREELTDSGENSEFILSEKPLISGSVSITSDDRLLEEGSEYLADHNKGSIIFLDNYGMVKIKYAVFPESLRERYFRYQTVESPLKTVKEHKLKIKNRYEPLELQIKGNKSISISIADDKDFQLDQSLFLQISGELSENVNIRAQVTDSESPLTPEGNSRELSNLDRLFIRIYGRNYDLGFGDMEHDFTGSDFLDHTSVFEGVLGRWGNMSRITGGVGLSRSESGSLEITAVEGRQGPYWLVTDYDGEALIIAGSEKVYLNGIEQHRGDDYTIDYAEGSITFSDAHFIRSTDRIYAVYQYADEEFRQSVYLGEGCYEAIEGISVGMTVYYVNDDSDNPLQQEFSLSDLDSLALAGDAPVLGSGAFKTDPGLGEYLLNSQGFYEYTGYDSTGNWIVSFYESKEGDYIKTGEGYFEYTGEGTGDYLPGVELSAPQSQGNFSFRSKLEKGEFHLKGELLYSENDLNTISDLDDGDNEGWGGKIGLNWISEGDRIKPYAGLNLCYLSKDLYTFDPVVDGLDHYEMDEVPDSLEQRKVKVDLGVDITGIARPVLSVSWLKAEDIQEQKLLKTGIGITQRGVLPEIDYRFLIREKVSRDTLRFQRHNGLLFYQIGFWKGGLEIEEERREEKTLSKRSGREQLFLEMGKTDTKGRLYWERVEADSIETVPETASETTGFNVELHNEKQDLDLNFAHRELQDSLKTSYDLGELSYSGELLETVRLDINYRVRHLDFYPRIKELVYAGEGEGNYDEDGQEDENGDYYWEVTSIDYSNPEKSVELTTGSTTNIAFGSHFPGWMQRVRLEWFLGITEQSTSDKFKDLYLLQGSELMDAENTIYGRQNKRGLCWLEILQNIMNLRLMMEVEKRMDNRYQVAEEMSSEKQELYLRWRYSQDIGFELFLKNEEESNSRYDLNSESNEIKLEIRYNSGNKIICNFGLTGGKEEDSGNSTEERYVLQKMELIPSISWFPGRGKKLYGRIKFRKNETEGEMLNSWQEEKREGNILLWDFDYEHRINKYVILNLEYSGENYPGDEMHHEFMMELRAEF